MANFVPRSQVSLAISQGSIIFFLLEDMSVMCIFLLTNSVGLKGKELQCFFEMMIFLAIPLSTRNISSVLTLMRVLIIRTFCAFRRGSRGGGTGGTSPLGKMGSHNLPRTDEFFRGGGGGLHGLWKRSKQRYQSYILSE